MTGKGLPADQPAAPGPGVRGTVRKPRRRRPPREPERTESGQSEPPAAAQDQPKPDESGQSETRPVDLPVSGLSTESIRDQRLAARALREGWHFTQEMRDELLAHQYKIATAKRGKPRDKSRAFVACLAADRAASHQVAVQINQQIKASRLEADTGAEVQLPSGPIDPDTATGPRVVLYLPDNGRHLT